MRSRAQGEESLLGTGGRTESPDAHTLLICYWEGRGFLPNWLLFSPRGEKKWAGVWELRTEDV